jgi:hypothetical protein
MKFTYADNPNVTRGVVQHIEEFASFLLTRERLTEKLFRTI